MFHEEFILKRHSENPIIKPKDFPDAEAVFNPGQTMYEGKTILLVSVSHRSGYYRGKQRETTHVAESTDGVHFKINPEPFLDTIDTRVTKIEDTYYIIYPAHGPGNWGTYGLLAKTKDFKKHEYIETISLPDNRIPCLFPEKINEKYFRVDRPYRVIPDNLHKFGNLWISSSPDLIHWGRYRPLLKEGGPGW